jgi:hypothetical protein
MITPQRLIPMHKQDAIKGLEKRSETSYPHKKRHGKRKKGYRK